MLNKVINRWGILAILLFTVSNGFISAPPSEIVLSLAGALTINNKTYFVFMLLAVVISNYIGTLILYGISLGKGKIWYDRLRKKKFLRKISF